MLRTINNYILELTGMVRKKLPNHVRQSTVSLLTCSVHQRDTLKALIKDQVQTKDEFKWQIQFKFEVKCLNDVIYNSAFLKGSYTDEVY